MKKERTSLILLVFLCLFSADASAGTIKIMESPLTIFVNNSGNVDIAVQFMNGGDEAAANVRLSLILPEGFSSTPNTVFIGTLETNKLQNVSFVLNVPDGISPGIYPVVARTDYTDLNQYPFSSVTPGTITLKEDTYPLLSVSMEQVTVEDKGKANLSLIIRNLDDKPHNLSIRLYLPREIKTDTTELGLLLDGKSERNISFVVSPFGALPKSTYVTFASIEYEDGSRHYLMYPPKPGVVSIGGELEQGRKIIPNLGRAELGESQLVKKLPYVLIILSIFVIYVSFRNKRGQNRKRYRKKG